MIKHFTTIIVFLSYFSCIDDKVTLIDEVTLDCILSHPMGEIPNDLYHVGQIIESENYPPFTKELNVFGVTLIARDDISNDFMLKIAKTIIEMFPKNSDIDTTLQKDLLTNIHKYKTIIPLFYGEDWFLSTKEEELWNITTRENSVCDIIMENIPGQIMEVVEHILHHVTNVGLHYSFPDEWGLSNSSILYNVTEEAIDGHYYNIQQYSDIEDVGVRMRVILQEYAYWIIYTSWDLREKYGPQDSEWSIMNRIELLNKLPDSYQLYNDIVVKVMACPSDSTLGLFID